MNVIVVDDSIIFRKQIVEILSEIEGIDVIHSFWNGEKFIEYLRNENSIIPDLVTMDVEMPEMDGIETVKHLRKMRHENSLYKKIKVLMVSALTKEGASATIAALQNGAFDFITKPVFSDAQMSRQSLKNLLIDKIHHLKDHSKEFIKKERKHKNETSVKKTEVIGIGVSTGGPVALKQLLPKISEITNLPILIVQHMPLEFTESLSHNLDKYVSHKVIVAENNAPVLKNHVYLAPGGRHMLVKKNGNEEAIIKINDNPPENGCKPSVDILFRSLADVFPERTIAVILTGMGSDGSKSMGTLHRNGAYIIAQNKESSVIWGMPGNAVATGYVNKILPLMKIPDEIMDRINE